MAGEAARRRAAEEEAPADSVVTAEPTAVQDPDRITMADCLVKIGLLSLTIDKLEAKLVVYQEIITAQRASMEAVAEDAPQGE